MFGRGYYDDSDDDDYGGAFSFHNPMGDLARMVILNQLMGGRRPFQRTGGYKFIKGWATSTEHEDTILAPGSIPRSLVSEKVADLFNVTGGFADLVFFVNEMKPIFAHQLVISSWSDILKGMILMKKKGLGEVREGGGGDQLLLYLRDSEGNAAVFEDFIRFMYTESVELSMHNAWAFMRLGAKYGVTELSRTTAFFLLRHVADYRIGPSLVQLMDTSVNNVFTRAIVPSVMTRLQDELFLQEPDVVASFDVDILCDVLRCSEVVAVNEFDIYQKLKPKLVALKHQGKDRDVLRLLSLLRLTQMMASELNEINSGEFADDIRGHFSGKLETALWTRTFFAEQSWEELPINTERARLYLECPKPFLVGCYHPEYESSSAYTEDNKTLGSETRIPVEITVRVEYREQSTPDDDGLGYHTPSECDLPVYLVKNGEHGVTKLNEKMYLSFPRGQFPRPMVDLHHYRDRSDQLFFKIVADCRIVSDETQPVRKIVTHTLRHTGKGVKRFAILPPDYGLPEVFEMKVKFVCYASRLGDVNLIKWVFGWSGSAQKMFKAVHY